MGPRWGRDGAKMGQSEPNKAKMGSRWAKTAPRRARIGQDGTKMSQVGAMLAGVCGQEAPRSTQEGAIGAMLGASWPMTESARWL